MRHQQRGDERDRLLRQPVHLLLQLRWQLFLSLQLWLHCAHALGGLARCILYSVVHRLQVGCRDRDECGPDGYYCGSNTDCTNLPGSFTCSCKSGYPHGSPSSRCYAPATIGTNHNINIINQ